MLKELNEKYKNLDNEDYTTELALGIRESAIKESVRVIKEYHGDLIKQLNIK
ncbi:TPA: hypothetical protein ACVT6Z_001387 [Clostridioides difficile]|uniref:hypothetical protein n=1 Tax=Clostridioides difficile TaxID=1496 RepID=UPI001C149DEF|nr:hypothetical protein [Clostridioides difficile]MCP8339004.1 hypothetical protein [Clostridioides difficile]MCP8368570.1 hypothetical protein [Clostridioides difficile]MCP8386676.1 hypothetical protein [Clostridioides difficile]HBF7929130.1 hypothetical protein [Clostridioides difficile]HCQ5967439.1 hypothetical protein [Clostridioides difficile]